MKIPKHDALALLKRIGAGDLISEADQTLPDPIDVDRDAELLARYGLERDRLMNCLGASP